MKLSVRNFGPIKQADIETKKYNFFIGNTSTGKSVVAKLIAIANSTDFIALNSGELDKFKSILADYCIDFEFKTDTIINISIDNEVKSSVTADRFIVKYTKKSDYEIRHLVSQVSDLKSYLKLFDNIPYNPNNVNEVNYLKGLKHFLKEVSENAFNDYIKNQKVFPPLESSIYIPAERNLISLFSNSIYSILSAGSVIPESILRFGKLYEKAKNGNKKFVIDFLKLCVEFNKSNDLIDLGDDKGKITFKQASSGMQSVIPLWVVFTNAVNGQGNEIIIEEPELNLFPVVQTNLLKQIFERANGSLSNIYITTHSPYVFSEVDNLIFANDIYSTALEKGNNDLAHKVTKLVRPETMIRYEDISSYYFEDNGNVKKVNDDKHRLSGADAVDMASDITSSVFDQLMDLENEL